MAASNAKKGTDAKIRYPFLVVGPRPESYEGEDVSDFEREILSSHKTSKAAKSKCGEGCQVWMWDSYINSAGGFAKI